jgi:hypothetical protein
MCENPAAHPARQVSWSAASGGPNREGVPHARRGVFRRAAISGSGGKWVLGHCSYTASARHLAGIDDEVHTRVLDCQGVRRPSDLNQGIDVRCGIAVRGGDLPRDNLPGFIMSRECFGKAPDVLTF